MFSIILKLQCHWLRLGKLEDIVCSLKSGNVGSNWRMLHGLNCLTSAICPIWRSLLLELNWQIDQVAQPICTDALFPVEGFLKVLQNWEGIRWEYCFSYWLVANQVRQRETSNPLGKCLHQMPTLSTFGNLKVCFCGFDICHFNSLFKLHFFVILLQTAFSQCLFPFFFFFCKSFFHS